MLYTTYDTCFLKTPSHVIDAYDLNIINNDFFILLHYYKMFLNDVEIISYMLGEVRLIS